MCSPRPDIVHNGSLLRHLRCLVGCLCLITNGIASSNPLLLDDVWLSLKGNPSEAADRVIGMLAASEADGLDAADYGIAELTRRAAALVAHPGSDDEFPRDLERSLGLFARDLAHGRVDPADLGFDLIARRSLIDDALGDARSAAVADRLTEWLEGVRPNVGLYAELRRMLHRYRGLATSDDPAGLDLPARSVRPGMPLPSAGRLRRRLVELGDMSDAASPVPPEVFDQALSDAVMRFQERHGLQADGVVGAETRKALEVPMADRVRQLELAMERLRWVPPLGGRPVVGINIPMFRLWALGAGPEPRRAGMRVVVGRALDTKSPILLAEITQVTFRPYWNVPHSIALGEVLPAIQKDPGHLARHDMEVVRGQTNAAKAVSPDTDALDGVRRRELRIRQRPGPENALGLLKFEMPNAAGVYLHDTPARRLFGQPRRDLSHGCIRLEDPAGLAVLLLDDPVRWSRSDVERAMNGSETRTIPLDRPARVVLYYMTAMVGPFDGQLRFVEDIYGHDARLSRALSRRAALRR